MSGRSVRFEEVPADGESKDDVLRYAAYFNDDHSSSSSSSSSPVTMADWILLVKEGRNEGGSGIAETMTGLLRAAPFAAFRFETPGVSVETVHRRPFEFVLVDDPYLQTFAAREDPAAFAEHLQCHDDNTSDREPAAACTFVNLGGDAILVSPRDWADDSTSNSNYHGHLANFVRGASTEQITETWRMVASALEEQLLGASPRRRPTSKPLWLSTAGDGVAWLHFRLDSRPKYYHYAPYREWNS